MTALPVPSPTPSDPARSEPGPSSRPARRLRPLASPPRRMARLPFLTILVAVFGLGMAGLLLLNTTLQNQVFAARTLNRQATELTYVQADLEARFDVAAAPASLAQKASALGMRANPYPAFLVVPSGKVIGHPKVVRGHEMPSLVVRDPRRQAADQLATDAQQAVQIQQRAQRQIQADQSAAADVAARAAAAAKKAAQPKPGGKAKKKPSTGAGN